MLATEPLFVYAYCLAAWATAVPADRVQQIDTSALPVKHPSRVRGPDGWTGPGNDFVFVRVSLSCRRDGLSFRHLAKAAALSGAAVPSDACTAVFIRLMTCDGGAGPCAGHGRFRSA
jgi:hypothetical protein